MVFACLPAYVDGSANLHCNSDPLKEIQNLTREISTKWLTCGVESDPVDDDTI
jgi:hypothetical protein